MPFVILPVHRGTLLTLSIITCHHITLPHANMYAVDNGSNYIHKAHLFILLLELAWAWVHLVTLLTILCNLIFAVDMLSLTFCL